ncbi:hypothetical protein F2Q70_00002244 [Brassica cretica]|uniref:Uncharacterized protein n=1 Tax=Brassica cretica TaxID=69181 RepID=A0A8S9IUS4_BRACR|nr:hypothetical protein F2Q70_00002244 [Brassica cretica]
MENEEGIGEGLIPVSVDLGMHDGDSWVPVSEEGANQEWSIHVTAASLIEDESNANSTLVSQEIENEEGRELSRTGSKQTGSKHVGENPKSGKNTNFAHQNGSVKIFGIDRGSKICRKGQKSLKPIKKLEVSLCIWPGRSV